MSDDDNYGLPPEFTVIDDTAANRIRTELEIDAFAARDDESASEAAWAEQLERALQDVQAKLAAGENKQRPRLFDGCDVADLLRREFPAASWLVDGLVTRGGITMIGAEPKAAKTWLGTELAVAVATGTRVCGEFFAQRGTVAYFYAEDLDRQVRNRVRALLAGRAVVMPSGRFFARPRGMFLDITHDDDLAWIVASCRSLDALDLLVLDPLRDIHSAAEDKSDEMSPVMRRLRAVAELLACTVAVVHHAPKANKDTAKRRPGQNLRGSGAIHGSVDSGIYLEDSDGDGTNLFTNTVTSQVKGARSAGKFRLELSVTDNAEGEATSAHWTVSRADFKRGPAKDQADDDTVLAFVRDLAATGQCLSRTALRTHDSRPIPEKRVTAALDRLLENRRLVLRAGRVAIPGQEGNSND